MHTYSKDQLEALITKYNRPIPRYTSYPPANFFSDGFVTEDYIQAIKESNTEGVSNVSFYIHIPFCNHLCHYCGCNSIGMRNETVIARYMKALNSELTLLLKQIDHNRKLAQIHYGGGSPSSIPIHYLKELNDQILSHFETIDHPEIAIECHPGYLDEKAWKDIIDAGFNRVSIGVQDFDLKVLKIANRRPSLLPVDKVVELLHQAGLTVNLDFIYGLPHQTAESFAETIQKAISCKPDRLVTFSYAHVPWVNKQMLILEKAGLPNKEEKQQMYDNANDLLVQAGYKPVGMDHFVKPTDELYLALSEGKLHRNFQGYCTRRTTGQVYGLGTTAISQLDNAYAQNTKNLDEYMTLVEENKLPIFKGYRLSKQEKVTREVIEMLMCNNTLDWKEVSLLLKQRIDEVKEQTAYDIVKLQDLADDGIIKLSPERIEMTKLGHPFVRNVAASLDPLLNGTEENYSKPL